LAISAKGPAHTASYPTSTGSDFITVKSAGAGSEWKIQHSGLWETFYSGKLSVSWHLAEAEEDPTFWVMANCIMSLVQSYSERLNCNKAIHMIIGLSSIEASLL
jgi:hypothetical protein